MVDWDIASDVPKTAEAQRLLQTIDMLNKKVVLLIAPDNHVVYSSFVNLPHVSVIGFDQPNAFDLINSDYWLLLKKDVELFKEMVARWL
jgi:ribosomal protein L4